MGGQCFEGACGDFHPVSRLVAKMGTRNQDGQGRHGTNDDGIDEGSQHGDQAFPNRFFGLGCRVGDSRRAQARFVGEGGPFHALHQHPDEATKGCLRRKSLGENAEEHGGHGANVGQHD